MKDLDKVINDIFDVPEVEDKNSIDKSKTFEEKISDVKDLMMPEPLEESQEPQKEELNKEEIEAAEKPHHSPAEVLKSKPKTQEVKTEPKKVQEPKIECDLLEEEDEIVDDQNPLGLFGEDFEVFKFVRDKYQQFHICSQVVGLKSFYRFKAKELGYVLKKHKLIDVESYKKEVSSYSIDFSIYGVPEYVALCEKLNQISRTKTRLSQIILEISSQIFLWRKIQEMLSGKLFLDKDIRGQQKRDGLALEHMNDVVHYVSEIDGLYEGCKRIDELLSTQFDSISRQISCVHSMREPQEIKQDHKVDKKPNEKYTHLESFEPGQVVRQSPPSKFKANFDANFGISGNDDDFLN